MGRYVPPDLEGTISANAAQKKHALGARASKLASHGILTVRFEMPFPIWCGTCSKPTIIGQGVRFNAEKKKVGNYYSTPIWSFRMRHPACGGSIEIRTDPKNTAYVVHEGATKQDTGEDRLREGDQVIMTEEEREALRSNAFASLEKTIDDREQLKRATLRIEDLAEISARQWDDPYAQNQRLRASFRVGRKAREVEGAKTEALKDKMSLGIDLLPASEEDTRRAALIDYGLDAVGGGDTALSRPLFEGAKPEKKAERTPPIASSPTTLSKGLKLEAQALKRKKAIVKDVLNNTRVNRDPFLLPTRTTTATIMAGRLSGIKRKQPHGDHDHLNQEAAVSAGVRKPDSPSVSAGLVDYDSD